MTRKKKRQRSSSNNSGGEVLIGMDVPYEEYLNRGASLDTAFVIHKVGVRKSQEKIYGPFQNIGIAQLRLREVVEHHLRVSRDELLLEPRLTTKTSRKCIVRMIDPDSISTQKIRKIDIFFYIKPIEA